MSYRSEIAWMLKNMPSDWRRQYDSGRKKLAANGGKRLPESPSPEQAMELIGITAGGNKAGDKPKGSNKVPSAVRDEAMLGIRLSFEHNYGAWDFIGLARAIQLVLSPGVPDSTHNRMRNYFTRHLKDKSSARFGSKSHPSRGYMAWLNWGGDAGARWVGAKTKRNPVTLYVPTLLPTFARPNNTWEYFNYENPWHRRSD